MTVFDDLYVSENFKFEIGLNVYIFYQCAMEGKDKMQLIREKLEEIRKIDSNLRFTEEEMEERRQKRQNASLLIKPTLTGNVAS